MPSIEWVLLKLKAPLNSCLNVEMESQQRCRKVRILGTGQEFHRMQLTRLSALCSSTKSHQPTGHRAGPSMWSEGYVSMSRSCCREIWDMNPVPTTRHDSISPSFLCLIMACYRHCRIGRNGQPHFIGNH